MGIRSFIKEIPLVGKVARSIYRIFVPNVEYPVYWINRYVKNVDLNIVQIGSNDGKSGDPISDLVKKNNKWNALFVEPVPYLFEKLKNNYSRESRFTFENAAINNGSNQIFYSVKEEANKHIQNLPYWYDQLGSFNRENIINHLDGILEPYIVETEVNGLTMGGVLKKNKIESIALLHIDTEGYDYKVLSQLDLQKFKPIIILFEYKHLNEVEKTNAILFLKDFYYLFEFYGDFLCMSRDKLTQTDYGKLQKREIAL